MRPLVSLRRALEDPQLLGPVLAGPSWLAWRVLLIAAMGEALTADEREVFTKLTGRAQEPLQRCEEFFGVIGRRGGKTRASAVLAVYISALCDHSDSLAAGERGLVLCLAQNQRTAAVAFGYAAAIFESQPLLAGLVKGRTTDTLSLSTGVDLEIRPASFRGLCGLTAVAVIADECAFWYTDETSANADTEILKAVRPSLATTGGPLVVISSPYAKRGEVYGAWRRHFGPGGDPLILVAKGASRDFNPSLPQSVVDRAMERDPAGATAEYLGEFRGDISSFVSREVVDAAVVPGRHELPPVPGTSYAGFVDPSGGSSDSMTLAIGHKDGDRVVVDAIRERRAPFSPDDVTLEFVALLKSYRVTEVHGDRYAGGWPRERLKVHGVGYIVAEKPKSDLYRDLLPALNAHRVELLDLPRLAGQLASLERRTARSGKDSIDHPPGQHDDVANCVAGVCAVLGEARPIDWSMAHTIVAQLQRRPSYVGYGRHGHALPAIIMA
jgi:hypothetical protein